MSFQITYEITHDVIATPNDQPIFSVVYSPAIDISMPIPPPIRTARSVNCFIRSPW